MPGFQIEQLAAAIGPAAILRGEPKLGIGQMRRAAAVSRQIERRIAKFMASDEFKPERGPLERDKYRDVLDIVSPDEWPADALNTAVPDREIAFEVGEVVAKIKQWANTAIPRDETPSFLSSALSSPSALTVADFLEQWAIACDPMQAVRDLENGELSEQNVMTLATLWPATYAAVRQAIVDANGALAARHGQRWEPEPRKASLLRTMMQIEPIDLDLAATVQQSTQQQQPQSAAQQPKRAAKTDETDTSSTEATPGQKAASA